MMRVAAYRKWKITGAILMVSLLLVWAFRPSTETKDILSYTATPSSLKFYWKDDSSNVIGNFARLKSWLAGQGQTLVFAMNGGMYMQDRTPLGLYVEEYKTLRPLNTRNAEGNFYLKPNGVFYLDAKNKAHVVKTEDFDENATKVRFATQSGPMLLVKGEFHPAFSKGSSNLNIRNGVGILPDGKVLFAMSKEPVNLYDFAAWFKEKGCKDALYLDGFVSRTYLPEENWVQTDGHFGVIIAAVKK